MTQAFQDDILIQKDGSGLRRLIDLERRDGQSNQGVTFSLDPTAGLFHIDVGGNNNSHARIHLGDMDNNDNPVTTLGNVGIGTVNPTEQLEVHGNILVTGDVQLSGGDCAEDFRIKESSLLEPGTVMVIGDEETLHHCTEAYDRKVARIISGAGDLKPGIVLGKQRSERTRQLLALSGKVFCKVDAGYGSIIVGDMLTTSPTAGHAMKAADSGKAFGATIGKALRPLMEGRGLIPILIALQ